MNRTSQTASHSSAPSLDPHDRMENKTVPAEGSLGAAPHLSYLSQSGHVPPPDDEDKHEGRGGDQPDSIDGDDKERIPLRYRLLAFSMILFFATGSSFCEATLGPLKGILIKKLGINNAQYGAIASAENLINTVLPIIGGLGMDYWGATYAALISSVFVVIGAVISAAAGNTEQYQLLIAGRILMGFGSTVIESTQNKLYAHWFSGSHLAFVFAIDIAWNRVTGVVAKVCAVPMSNINGWWGWALWIPAIVTGFNLALVIVYWIFERNVPKMYRPKLGKDARSASARGWAHRRYIVRALFSLPKFFWILCGTQIFQNAAVSVYTSNLADIQTKTRGTSALAAGYNSSLQGVIPIVLTPAVGYFFDRFGWRMIFVSWTAALYIVVFVLIGLTKVHPLAPILISSFALTSNAITFIASIPVLVGNDALLGTAFGVWKSFTNVNNTILEVSAGAIQDRSRGSYTNVIYLLIAIKAVEMALGPVYDYIDGKWLGHSLRMPEKRRLEVRQRARELPDDLPGWRISKKVMYTVLAQLAAMVIVAWVLYIYYSLGT